MNMLGSHDTPRLLNVANGDPEAVKMALACMFAYPGAPCVYYGDEIGTPGDHDPDCRRGFEWDERFWNADLHGFVRTLTRLRKECRALRRGDFDVLAGTRTTAAWSRTDRGATAVFAINAGKDPARFTLPIPREGARVETWISTRAGSASLVAYDEGRATVTLAGRSALVVPSGHR